MNDSVTTTSTKSYGSRLLGSFKGVIFGIILVIAAIIILWINEGNFVKNDKAYREGAKVVVPVQGAKALNENNQKLIHISGETKSSSILTDETFPVQSNGLALNRLVETYQWKEKSTTETKEKLGGSEETKTTYTYEKVWSRDIIDSDNFNKRDGHVNPTQHLYSNSAVYSPTATIGDFKLNSAIINSIDSRTPVLIGQDLDISSITGATVVNGAIFIGEDFNTPAIGDTRITFTEAATGNASIIARQDGASLAPYQTSTGTSLQIAVAGLKSAEEMFEDSRNQNSLFTWLIRGIGVVIMWAGFSMILGPLSMLTAIVPFIRRILSGATGIIAGLITIILSGLVIALAWLFYRPLIALLILTVVTVAIVLLVRKRKQPKSPSQPEAPIAS